MGLGGFGTNSYTLIPNVGSTSPTTDVMTGWTVRIYWSMMTTLRLLLAEGMMMMMKAGGVRCDVRGWYERR